MCKALPSFGRKACPKEKRCCKAPWDSFVQISCPKGSGARPLQTKGNQRFACFANRRDCKAPSDELCTGDLRTRKGLQIEDLHEEELCNPLGLQKTQLQEDVSLWLCKAIFDFILVGALHVFRRFRFCILLIVGYLK